MRRQTEALPGTDAFGHEELGEWYDTQATSNKQLKAEASVMLQQAHVPSGGCVG